MSKAKKIIPNSWFILRVIAYLINKVIAVYLLINITEVMPRLYVFLGSSVFDLFIIGELNIKPANVNFEIKK